MRIPRMLALIMLAMLFIEVSMLASRVLASNSAIEILPTTINGSIVEKDITTNTTWDREHSPYIIIRSIKIYRNATLRIEPGVIVKFANGVTITVEGEIIANGAKDSRISLELINPKGGSQFITLKMCGGKVILRNVDVKIPFLVLDGIPPRE